MRRIGLVGENSTEYIEKLIQIWNNGDSAVLIDWRIPFKAAIQLMDEAGVATCYLEDGKYENCDSFSKIDFIRYRRKSNSAEFLPKEDYEKFKANYSQDEAIVLYSSGTTGMAKGIVLSHYAINSNSDAIIDYMKPMSQDCIYIAKALSHSSTLVGEVLVALKSRAKLIVTPTIVHPRFILQNICKHGVSIICLNPDMLSSISAEYSKGEYKSMALRAIYVSGSILNDKIYYYAREIFKNVPIYNVYGLSEAGPRVTAQRMDCCKSNSVGKPIRGVDIKIIDDNGNIMKKGERGIVYVNTPSKFKKYVVGNEKESCYPGWLNTGDIGYIDMNEELHIVGREDDLVIINAYKVYPSSIEGILLTHKGIDECTVLQTDKYGLTCIYTKITSRDIKKEIINLLTNKLAYYEIPRKFICVESIPKTNIGKINTYKIRKMIDEGEGV